ncbi:MAG: hypothetical protein R3282_04745, partial [Rhodothermales bacterium]|nr:hypothetical protein [Rhodothermales bacterium]
MDGSGNEIRIITDEQVEELLSMRTAIELMRDAFAALSSGAATVPVRSSVVNETTRCTLLSMPAVADEAGFVHKAVSVQPANPDVGIPSVNGLVTVFDRQTGRPRAIMGAEALTAIRTGAATGLATDLLALEGARILAVFGTGPQARTQVDAVCCVREIEHILVYGRDQSKAASFAEAVATRAGVPCTSTTSRNLLRDADVVCAATSSPVPVFEATDILPGCHVNGVGSYRL